MDHLSGGNLDETDGRSRQQRFDQLSVTFPIRNDIKWSVFGSKSREEEYPRSIFLKYMLSEKVEWTGFSYFNDAIYSYYPVCSFGSHMLLTWAAAETELRKGIMGAADSRTSAQPIGKVMSFIISLCVTYGWGSVVLAIMKFVHFPSSEVRF